MGVFDDTRILHGKHGLHETWDKITDTCFRYEVGLRSFASRVTFVYWQGIRLAWAFLMDGGHSVRSGKWEQILHMNTGDFLEFVTLLMLHTNHAHSHFHITPALSREEEQWYRRIIDSCQMKLQQQADHTNETSDRKY